METGGRMQPIGELKQQYEGEWLAVRVTRYENFEPIEGELAYHAKDRSELLKNIQLRKQQRLYITYAGPLIEEGYAVAFHAN